jgi:hypothetical protein
MVSAYTISVGTSEGTGSLERVGVNGRAILKSILKRNKGVDWSHLNQDGVPWWVLVNTAMSFPVP